MRRLIQAGAPPLGQCVFPPGNILPRLIRQHGDKGKLHFISFSIM